MTIAAANLNPTLIRAFAAGRFDPTHRPGLDKPAEEVKNSLSDTVKIDTAVPEKTDVELKLAYSELRPALREPVTRELERRDISETTRLNRPERVDGAERVEPTNRPPVFTPGESVSGNYRNGNFITESGYSGTYKAMPGGQISFEINGFKGIFMSNHTAMVYNNQTGESYEMKVRVGDGKFEIIDIKELSEKPFDPAGKKPLFVEGQSNNVHIRHDSKGNVGVSFPGPDGETVTGQGFMDPDGVMILALSNGATIKVKYDFSADGKLQIYSRKAID